MGSKEAEAHSSLPLHPSKVMPWIPTKREQARCPSLICQPPSELLVLSQTVESLWQTAMTWRPPAFPIRLGEVIEGNKPSARSDRKSGGAAVPGFSSPALAVADEWKKCRRMSVYCPIIIHAFTKAHSCTRPLFSLCLLAGILSS